MGMKPQQPDKSILDFLEMMEQQINSDKKQNQKEKIRTLKRIQDFKQKLPWMNNREEDALVNAMSIGVEWADTVPRADRLHLFKFDQSRKTKKACETTGQKHPGRPSGSKLQTAAHILASRIKPVTEYKIDQCRKDIIKHYKHVEHIILKKPDSEVIITSDGKPKKLRSLKDEIVKEWKKQETSVQPIQ